MLSQMRRNKTSSQLESMRPLRLPSPDGSDSSSSTSSFSSKVIKFKRSNNRRRKSKRTTNHKNTIIYRNNNNNNDNEESDGSIPNRNSILGCEKTYHNENSIPLKKSYHSKKKSFEKNDTKYPSEKKRAILGDISNQRNNNNNNKSDMRWNHTFSHGNEDDESCMNTAVTSISDHEVKKDNRRFMDKKKKALKVQVYPSSSPSTRRPPRKHTTANSGFTIFSPPPAAATKQSSQGGTSKRRRRGSHIYILLIGPQDRMFELLHMQYPSHFPQFENIIRLISQNAAERKFKKQNHVGICKIYPNEKKHGDSDMIQSIHSIRNGDILVAVPKGYNHEYCRLIGQIIFKKNPHLDTWILNSTKKRPNKHHHSKHITTKPDSHEISGNIPSESLIPKAIDFEYDLATSPSPSTQKNDTTLSSNDDQKDTIEEISRKVDFSFDSTQEDNTDLSIETNETFHEMDSTKVLDSCHTEADDLPVIQHREVVNPLKPTTSQNDFLAENLGSISRFIREKYGDKKARIIHIIAFLFTIQSTLYITSLFRVLQDNNNKSNSERPLDMDGLIRVIIMVFLLSKIQQNWDALKKCLVKTQRQKRRLVYSGNSFRQLSRSSSRAIKGSSRSLSSRNNIC